MKICMYLIALIINDLGQFQPIVASITFSMTLSLTTKQIKIVECQIYIHSVPSEPCFHSTMGQYGSNFVNVKRITYFDKEKLCAGTPSVPRY